MANNWVDLGSVWSGRDMAEGERITVNVFDKVTQDMLEQTTFVAKAGRLEQLTWVIDLCKQVNARMQLIQAGVKADTRLEIPGSSYLNKFWNVTGRDVQVITTTASSSNWPAAKRVAINMPVRPQPWSLPDPRQQKSVQYRWRRCLCLRQRRSDKPQGPQRTRGGRRILPLERGPCYPYHRFPRRGRRHRRAAGTVHRRHIGIAGSGHDGTGSNFLRLRHGLADHFGK
ncbi:hypothetical protein [Pseudomonas putida]|uniref:hypothetical protein n=1 Tax=Pseudomonas putida TaxID=303 RepID=UPI00197F053C|nr:hypothetical protein [Pseudomonas putida]